MNEPIFEPQLSPDLEELLLKAEIEEFFGDTQTDHAATEEATPSLMGAETLRTFSEFLKKEDAQLQEDLNVLSSFLKNQSFLATLQDPRYSRLRTFREGVQKTFFNTRQLLSKVAFVLDNNARLLEEGDTIDLDHVRTFVTHELVSLDGQHNLLCMLIEEAAELFKDAICTSNATTMPFLDFVRATVERHARALFALEGKLKDLDIILLQVFHPDEFQRLQDASRHTVEAVAERQHQEIDLLLEKALGKIA